MKANSFRSISAVIVSLLLLCSSGLAQAVSGKIAGHVSDPTGATVPNAAVTVTDLERAIKYETVSNETGNYEQNHLLAGRYKVRISAPK